MLQFHSLIPQRGEKAGTKLQTDGEDEQHQTELLHEMQRVLIHRISEVPHDDSGEKHARGAETDAAELNAAERHPENTDKSQRTIACATGWVRWQIEQPAHSLGLRRGGFHFVAGAGGVGLEILIEKCGEFLRRRVVGRLIGPAVARS